MSNPADHQDDQDQHDGDHEQSDRDHDVKVTVSFSMSEAEPFVDKFDPSITVGAIRKAAMVQFAADEDPNHVYYLSFERERRDDSITIGSLAEHRRAIKLRLIKEITQG